jgi:hypothetical protein
MEVRPLNPPNVFQPPPGSYKLIGRHRATKDVHLQSRSRWMTVCLQFQILDECRNRDDYYPQCGTTFWSAKSDIGVLDWDDVTTYLRCSGYAEYLWRPDGPEEPGEGSPETSREEANAVINSHLCELKLR